ncbi:uncharacterized protein Z518_03625 [Rhinocladiella mackenziei CBS 650.93]|uniref:Rhinocladiella mackenziei CBS 650.93 unplaced genomic scaffold supercont1.3, whole genome shotgun sequence n=1 Tax=Rhinocladiella mackenziei CBS 650.93 TaxID=1442369 RepID=A0A0D2H5G3_9EURO|nr:uncharacterized protein Z518_03625 [Rhinocladiella mackenziei CBS 650.93]KIX05653.1 hypothetical protein Z518_03625 [Rhinocladiella mackenziei CBS 650.93]
MNTERTAARRTKKSCEQCYHRKVRCHGRSPGCEPCQRLGFACTFAQDNSSVSLSATITTNQPRKLRGGNACLQCRKQKTRCSQGVPQCSNCAKKKWTCVYASPYEPEPLGIQEQSPPSSLIPDRIAMLSASDTSAHGRGHADVGLGAIETPGHSLLESPVIFGPDQFTSNLVQEFFKVLHPTPSFSFLHPRTTQERLVEGSLDEALVFAICGITISKQKMEPVARDRSLAWISKSEELVWQHLESPNMARLQALILCVAYHIDTGASHRAFMLAGLAARAATAMRLNHERHHLDLVSNEVRRRTLWSLKILELYFSIGLPEYELLPFENVYLQLPSREEHFQDSASSLHTEGGAYRLFVRLTSMRRDIMKLNRSITLCDEPFPLLLKLIRGLHNELNHLRCQMPAGSDSVMAGVTQFVETPWLARHLVMQLSWHQCRCDLYRLLLPGYPEAAPAVVLASLDAEATNDAVQMCTESSLSIIQTLSDVNSHCAHSPILEYDAAICGYHAGRLVLFLAHSQAKSSRLSKEYAISRAELCLAAIKRFFRYSAPVDPILKDLERLISACSSSPDDWTHLIFISPPNEEARDPVLSEVARAKQRLAIHSLLRQAEFEGGEPSSVVSPSSASIELPSTRHRNMYRVLSLEQDRSARLDSPLVYVPQPGTEEEQPDQHGNPSTSSSRPLLFPWCE